MFETMNLITVNLAKGAKLREEKKDGIDYLIAPVAMIVPGVLAGANSPPTLYPVDLISNTYERWDDYPVVYNHPQNSKGKYVSVNSSDWDGEDRIIGFISNSGFDGKLRTEIWINVEKLKKIDSRLLDSIMARKKIEVSTGLFANTKQESGEFNGKKYTHRLVDFIPDHLAILSDGVPGACSVFDGCGIHANEELSVNMDKMITVEDEGMRRSLIKMFKSLLGVKPQEEVPETTADDETESVISTNTLDEGDTNVCTKDELIASVIANSDHFKESDKLILNQMDETRLKELETSAKKTKDLISNAATLAANKKKEEDEAAKKKEEEKTAPNANEQKLTTEEWLKNAPQEVQAVFNHSKQLVANAKAELINKLTSHIKDDAKKQERIVALQAKSLEELQDRIQDIPEQPQMNQAPQGLFFGAVGGPNLAANQEKTKEVLDIPAIDWSKENRFAKSGK